MKTIIAIAALTALILAGCADPAQEATTGTAANSAADVAADQAMEPATDMAAATAGVADAADAGPADFSGTWILNTDRGENLGMMKAVNETIIATQTDEQIVFDMTDVFAGMTTTRTLTYDLNGKTMQNKAAMGADSETVSKWDGNKLVTTWTEEGAIAGTTTERMETRWLSDQGKTLSVSMARGDNPAMLFVYEKAE